MPVHIDYEPNDICVLRISGVLKQSEFAAEQSALANKNRHWIETSLIGHS
jgi:hypothetical protein